MAGYLFVHFIGDFPDGEQVYFSRSRDGLHWQDLNGGQLVLRSTVGECGARDPFVVRHPQTGKFYLMATDLCIANGKGWQIAQYGGSRDLLIWQSDDLLHWDGPRAVTLGVEGAGCVWAPEAIWDEAHGDFLVFWASMVQLPGDEAPKQRIYASHTADFVTFTAPQIYLQAENHVIDMNILHAQGYYYRFTKDETTKRIIMDRLAELDGTPEPVPSAALEALEGVEGPECYPLPDGRYCLIVDRFAAGKGYLPMLCDDLAGGVFTPAEDYDLGATRKRHGGVLPLTDAEYATLDALL